MRTIQIGIEVHKAIEAERRSLEESEDEILIRVLGLEQIALEPAPKPTKAAWTKAGVTLPHSTRLRAEYSGQTVEGVVDDGMWLVNGKRHSSPSMALIENVKTKRGKRTNLNGWNYWVAKRPSDAEYSKLAYLRYFA
jgi:hypothetical protein